MPQCTLDADFDPWYSRKASLISEYYTKFRRALGSLETENLATAGLTPTTPPNCGNLYSDVPTVE